MLDISIDSFHFYFLVAVLQGLVLAGIIIVRKPIRRTSLTLGIIIFLFSLSLLHGVLEESIHAFNGKFPVPMDYGFAFAPLFYFHIKFILQPNSKSKLKDLAHFIPTILIDGLFFFLFFSYLSNHLTWANENVQYIQLLSLCISMLGILQIGVYVFFIRNMVHVSSIKALDFAANIQLWFKTLGFFGMVILAFLFIAIPIAILNIDQLDDHTYLIYKPFGILIGLCIYGLGYRYLLKHMNVINAYVDRKSRSKYPTEELAKKKKQLIRALVKDKVFQDQTLTVGKLASHLSWPIKDVSLVIAEALETNFSDLINQYRIKAFKDFALSAEGKKYSIMGMAKEVGFNSKASFYRAFKKESGLTPSEFLSNHTAI